VVVMVVFVFVVVVVVAAAAVARSSPLWEEWSVSVYYVVYCSRTHVQ
jgi:hypothetical protein